MNTRLRMIVVLSFFLFSGLIFGKDRVKPEEEYGVYEIISDTFNGDIPEGSIRLRGTIKQKLENTPVAAGYVKNGDNYSAKVDENGEFEIEMVIEEMTTSQYVFYFFANGYLESVVWKYDLKSQHEIVINFFTELRPQEIYEVEEKPVIYMYSDEPLTASVSLDFKGEFTFTYPEYKVGKGWEVMVSEEGLAVDGKKYPYLFWEGKMKNVDFVSNQEGQIEGVFIDTDSTISYLENTLGQIGLNSTELTDFMTYWGPRIQAYPYATVQFLLDADYSQNIAGITCDPAPESQLRVYLLFEGSTFTENSQPLVPPSFSTFKREGFTLVEWGGTELSAVGS